VARGAEGNGEPVNRATARPVAPAYSHTRGAGERHSSAAKLGYAREHRKRRGRILKHIEVLRVAHEEHESLDAARLGNELLVDRVVEGEVAERRRDIALDV